MTKITQPEAVNRSPLGVIDTFTAGLSLVGRQPWLLLLPILLDLFFWIGPPIRLGPELAAALAAPFDPAQLAGMEESAELATQMKLVEESILSLAGGWNLWSLLVPPMLFLPTVLAGRSDVGVAGGLQLDGAGAVLAVALLLGLVGLWINVLWLTGVARTVGGDLSVSSPGGLVRRSLRLTGRLLAIGLLLLALLIGMLIPLSLLLAVVTLLLPAVGQGLASLTALVSFWAVLWVAIHLYFTAAAVVLVNEGVIRAPWLSVTITRRFFSSAIGFILISTLLSTGFQFIWSALGSSAVGRAASIVGNAALGTAIALAMMIFVGQRAQQLMQDAA